MKTLSLTLAMLTSAVAVAQPKADKAPVVTPPGPGPGPGKDTKVAGPAGTIPTVPTELIEMGKLTSGTWKCKGEAFERNGSRAPITAVNKAKVELDKWWLSENLEVKGMKMGTFKLTTYTTYDATAKKWRRVGLDNWGGQMVGTADGADITKPLTYNLDTIGPMGPGQFRDHVDATDLKAGIKMWGESSSNKGKTWDKVYDLLCKK